MKKCSTCKEDKDESEFHPNKQVKSGIQAACKICKRLEKKRYKEKNRQKVLEDAREYAKRSYAENPEKWRERHKTWIENNQEKYQESCKSSKAKSYLENKEKIKLRNKKYIEDNRDKVRERRRDYKRRNRERIKALRLEYEARYPEKAKAYRAINNAIARGLMTKPTNCARCLSVGLVEGHHPDYSNPLEVIWLCRKCHNKEHGK